MSFFDTSNAVAEAGTTQPIAYAPAAGPMAAWKLAYEAQWRASSLWGLEQAFEQADEEQARSGRGTPDAIGFPKLRDIADYDEIAAYFTDGDEEAFGPEQRAALQHYDQAVARARQQGRPVKSARALWATVQERAQAAERSWERTQTTLGGSIAGFLGGAVASLDPRTDPLNFATIPLGGFGKTAVMRVASQVGVQGAAETLNQLTGVQENRRLLGLEHGFRQAAMQVGASAVGAGVLQGLGEGIARGVRHWRGRRADERPAAGPQVQRSEAPWRGTGGGDARASSDLAEVAEQLDAWEGPKAAAVKPKHEDGKLTVADEDPVSFQVYADLERDLADSHTVRDARLDRIDQQQLALETRLHAESGAAAAVTQKRIELLRGERTRLAGEGIVDTADVSDLKAQQAALRPLLMRAYARSKGRFEATREDVVEATRILDQEGGARALGARPGNRGEAQQPDEMHTVSQRASSSDDTFSPRELTVPELSDRGVEIPGFERSLALDDRVLVPGDHDTVDVLTVRDVVEQDQVDDVFLSALQGCQTRAVLPA